MKKFRVFNWLRVIYVVQGGYIGSESVASSIQSWEMFDNSMEVFVSKMKVH